MDLRKDDKELVKTLLLARRSEVIMQYGEGKVLIGTAYDKVAQIDRLLKLIEVD